MKYRYKCTYNFRRFVKVPAYNEKWWDSDKELEKPRKLFKFSIVNSYGTAEMEQKLKDDDNPLKLSSKLFLVLTLPEICRLSKTFMT